MRRGTARTDNGEDPLDGLSLSKAEIAARLEKARKANAARQPRLAVTSKFIKVPLVWAEKLDPVTLKVLMFILHRAFQNHGPGFPVATAGLHVWGISRKQKTRALRGLEQLGLISLELRSRRNPIVRRIDV